MIQTSASEEALRALAEFKAYAAGPLLVLDLAGTFVLIFDGAGLAVFAVAGTQKALGFGLNPLMSALLGMLTGIGGGMLRDVLLAQVPTVLRSELYALAALAGASLVGPRSCAELPAHADRDRRCSVLLRDPPHCHTTRVASSRRLPATSF